jgi:hypothetical protein
MTAKPIKIEVWSDEMLGAVEAGDSLVPDNIVALELGGVSRMTLLRWSADPAMSFPPVIKHNNRCYRSRKALEQYKQHLKKQAIRNRKLQKEEVKTCKQ